MNRIAYIIFGLLAASSAMSSCVSRGNNPGWEYAPDMYYSKGYEPYSQGDSNSINPNGMSMREPVRGSVALGQLDYVYPYENNGEGYEASKALDYPEGFQDNKGLGQYKYEIYCAPCHGKTGGNDGEVFKKAPTLKPVWKGYTDDYIRNLPIGQIYHVIEYGKNNMGSHAPLLNPTERWAVIKYVKQLSGAPAAAGKTTDSIAKPKI